MKRNKAVIALCLLMALIITASAQTFRYEMALKPVPADGFYKIVLNSDVLAAVSPDLRDLRITDNKSRFIPYIREAKQIIDANEFTPLSIMANITDTAGNTVLDIENTTGNGIANVSFFIKNTYAERQLSVSGSNDRGKWFIIREDILLTPAVGYDRDEFMQSIAFPLSTYRYLRFVIRNNKSDALNIVSAGLINNSSAREMPPTYITHTAPTTTQKDSSNGNSYIYIDQNNANFIEQLSIDIAAPPLYERPVTLYRLDEFAQAYLQVRSFTLSSKGDRSFIIPATTAQSLMLVIENGDNLPLSVSGVSLGYLPKTIITYLEKGKDYSLLLNAADATPPNYDLEQFRDSIPQDAPLLTYEPIEIIEGKTETEQKDSKAIIWIAIIAGIGLLGFFTFKLAKDMNEQKGVG
ncbi:MAG: DUF3999 family protein [Sphingobacteriales bacterium]|nr:MAG: DUF3999 family protein [Sphingobacteriales bacterium]